MIVDQMSIRVKRTGEVLWQGTHIGTLIKETRKHVGHPPTTVWFYKPLLKRYGGKGHEYAGARRAVLRELTRELACTDG